MKKTFPASLNELDNVLAFADGELDKAGCPMGTQSAINVAMEEIFVNIAHYAYTPKEGTADVEIVIDGAAKEVSVTFTDSGVAFDPLKKQDPDTSLAAEDRKIGGLGILMVKKMMDDVAYQRIDGKNVFTMIKKY